MVVTNFGIDQEKLYADWIIGSFPSMAYFSIQIIENDVYFGMILVCP